MRLWWSALTYFAVVFSAGFALGAMRVTIIAPGIGDIAAVLLELPFMLGISWVTCRRVVRYFAISSDWTSRLAMGGLAFLMLMLIEPCVAVFGFNRSFSDYLASFKSASALIGLMGQLGFAFIPVVQSMRR